MKNIFGAASIARRAGTDRPEGASFHAHRGMSHLRSFTIIGLSHSGEIVFTQGLETFDLDDACTIARHLQSQFPKIELWEDGACVFRDPDLHAAPAEPPNAEPAKADTPAAPGVPAITRRILRGRSA
jgi:hypothetical protein